MADASLRVLRAADVPDNRTGGMSRTMHCTGDELKRAGHHVDVLFHEDFRWPVPRQAWRYARTWELLAMLRRRLAGGERWDVVELHEPLGFAYGLARRRDRSLPPMVLFSYGLEERAYQAMRAYRRAKGVGFRLRSRITSRLLVAQANAALRLADHVVCSSAEDVEHLVRRHGLRRDRLTLHHSGVEEGFLDACAPAPAARGPGLLFLGSWIERKGIGELVPAVAEVLAARPDAWFTAGGCGESVDAVQAHFPPGLRPRIRVVPRIANDTELASVCRGHALLVLPSYFEGQPLVMIEAAAAGLAIVTTPVCGMPDFMTDGVEGRFVPVGDAPRLAATLRELLDDPVRLAALGVNARRRAESHTWRRATQRIEQAYRSAIASQGVP